MNEMETDFFEFESTNFNDLNFENETEIFSVEQIIGDTLESNEIFEELIHNIAKGIHESL
ncbi:hypothetical protein [Faecalibacter sp. LW9]|uniref:hypothetical protein n=1 Tax=Faecalibacter sp. LW9 TaxID=3103144 RepID=UPI002AFFFDB3|nr:hypothetical protein [Faecalibacter sp. LW9]